MVDENRLNQQERTKRFYDLVWPHRAAVLRVARMLSRWSNDAEDLAQVTFMKAFAAVETCRDESGTRAWLLTILRHVHVDHLRSTKAEAAEVRLEELPSEAVASKTHETADVAATPVDLLNQFGDQQIIDALQELPEEIRWTLLLVDVEGLAHPKAAEILQVPVGTIKSRAHRGRAMLREALLPLAHDRRLVSRNVDLRQDEV